MGMLVTLVFATVFLSCSGFLFDDLTTPRSNSGSSLSDQNFIKLAGMIGQERQSRENYMLQIKQKILENAKKTSTLEEKIDQINSINDTVVDKRDFDQYKKDFEHQYALIVDENDKLKRRVDSSDQMIIKMKMNLAELKKLNSINELQEIQNLKTENAMMKQQLQTTNNRINGLVSIQQARGQDFLALYNQTKDIKTKIHSLDNEMIKQNQTSHLLKEDSASTHNFEKKSPRKPVSEWISETTSICNEKNAILDDLKQKLIEHHIAALSKLSYNGASVHFRKSPADLVALDPEDVIQEMKLHLPFLFNFLDALINDNTGSKQGTITMIYGMIIHSRNKQASLMQRLLSTLLIKNGASNQLMTRLNKFHLTLTGDSKPTLLKEFGKYNMKMISKEISHGKDGKLNGDNVDIYVRTNDIRMNSCNKDYHFFASDWTPFRVSTEDFQDHTFIREVVAQRRTVDVSPDDFLVNEAELKLFVNYFSIILGRVMMKNCEHFKWLNAVLPKHVKHEVSDIMSRQTTSHMMPIILKNEAKYDDCIQILDSYVKQLREW